MFPVVSKWLEELRLEMLRVDEDGKGREDAKQNSDETARLVVHHLAALVALAEGAIMVTRCQKEGEGIGCRDIFALWN